MIQFTFDLTTARGVIWFVVFVTLMVWAYRFGEWLWDVCKGLF